MHHSLKDLLDYTVEAGDTTGRIEDFLFDERRLHLAAVAVDLGNWLVSRSAILSAERLGRPDPGPRRIPLQISAEEAEGAPSVENWDAGWFDPPGVTAWPPIIIGPAGGTISPLMLQAQAQSATGNTGIREPGDRPRDLGADPRRLRSFLTTISGPVFCADGEFGQITDFLVDFQTRDIGYIILDTGGFLAHDRHAVPAAAVSHFAEGENYLVLHVTREAVEAAPTQDDPATADAAWLKGLDRYYQSHLPATPKRA